MHDEEEKYRTLVELSPDAIIVHIEGKVVYVNPAGMKIMGAKSPEEIIGKSMIDFVHPDFRERVRERVRRIQDEGGKAELIEEKLLRLDGREIDAEVTGGPTTYMGKPAVVAILRDISKRKQAEEDLKKAHDELEQRIVERTAALASTTEKLKLEIAERKREEQNLKTFSDAVENAYDGIVLTDLDRNLTYANASALEISGYTLDELRELSVDKWVPDPQISLQIMEEEMKTGKWEGEFNGMRKNGKTFPCMMSASLFKDKEGNPLGTIGIFRDITEHKQAEDALREFEERYRFLVENFDGPVMILDKDGIFLLCNEPGARYLGGEPDDFIGKSMFKILPGKADEFLKRHRKIINSGVGGNFEDVMELPSGKQ